MFKYLVILTLILFCEPVFAQNIVINGERSDRILLTWDDFLMKPPKRALAYTAITQSWCYYSWDSLDVSKDTAQVIGLTTTAWFLGERSYVVSSEASFNLLKHEQGHFFITILLSRAIDSAVKNTIFRSVDAKKEIPLMISKLYDEYIGEQKKYDIFTRHGGNEEEQHKWDVYFAERMKATEPKPITNE